MELNLTVKLPISPYVIYYWIFVTLLWYQKSKAISLLSHCHQAFESNDDREGKISSCCVGVVSKYRVGILAQDKILFLSILLDLFSVLSHWVWLNSFRVLQNKSQRVRYMGSHKSNDTNGFTFHPIVLKFFAPLSTDFFVAIMVFELGMVSLGDGFHGHLEVNGKFIKTQCFNLCES